jgi:hypothetical protein
VIVKILFAPFSVLGGILAGLTGKRIFERIWRIFDDREPPEPKGRDVTWQKLLAALALQGVVFRVTRGAVDHGSRRAFFNLTGRWPGEERPKSE